MTELLVTHQVSKPYGNTYDLGADAFVIGEQKFGLRLQGNSITTNDRGCRISSQKR